MPPAPTPRRGHRFLHNVKAVLHILKKSWCLHTFLLDFSEYQSLHLNLVGMFDNGHKCPDRKMCWHKHLLAQGLRTQVHAPSKPHTCCTRIWRVIFGGAKPKSRWVETALLGELMCCAAGITLGPESAPLWQSLCGDLKPS